MIAVGIGLHNLGEGLAIGAAYSLGEIALGGFLVIGFIIQNITEGLGIIAPVLRDRPSWKQLALLGVIGGAPAILGSWIGAFTPSPILAVLFLAIGTGAVFEVVYEIAKADPERHGSPAHAHDRFLWHPGRYAAALGNRHVGQVAFMFS